MEIKDIYPNQDIDEQLKEQTLKISQSLKEKGTFTKLRTLIDEELIQIMVSRLELISISPKTDLSGFMAFKTGFLVITRGDLTINNILFGNFSGILSKENVVQRMENKPSKIEEENLKFEIFSSSVVEGLTLNNKNFKIFFENIRSSNRFNLQKIYEVLQEVKIFEGIHKSLLATLAVESSLQSYSLRSPVFNRGDTTKNIFICLKGSAILEGRCSPIITKQDGGQSYREQSNFSDKNKSFPVKFSFVISEGNMVGDLEFLQKSKIRNSSLTSNSEPLLFLKILNTSSRCLMDVITLCKPKLIQFWHQRFSIFSHKFQTHSKSGSLPPIYKQSNSMSSPMVFERKLLKQSPSQLILKGQQLEIQGKTSESNRLRKLATLKTLNKFTNKQFLGMLERINNPKKMSSMISKSAKKIKKSKQVDYRMVNIEEILNPKEFRIKHRGNNSMDYLRFLRNRENIDIRKAKVMKNKVCKTEYRESDQVEIQKGKGSKRRQNSILGGGGLFMFESLVGPIKQLKKKTRGNYHSFKMRR